MIEGDPAEARFRMAGGGGGIVERGRTQPLKPQPLHVEVRDRQLGIGGEAAALCEEFAQLENRSLAVPGEVGGALARPGGGKDVGGDRARALRRGQHLALVRLADRDVGCRQIAQDRRAGERARRRGRGRRPIILADFEVEDEVARVGRGEDQVGPERRALPGDGDVEPVEAQPRHEPALFVIFAVIGQEDLGHNPQNAAAVDGDRAIVEPPVAPEARADRDDGREFFRRRAQPCDPVFHRVEKRLLHVQVVDRVGREVEFGKHDQVDTAARRLLGQRDRLVDIERDVAR